MADVTAEAIGIDVMTQDFILWRCLHGGPLSPVTIEHWPADTGMPWERYRARNEPLLRKLTDLYGACAILAWQEDQVIGQLRFYPNAVWEAAGGGVGMLCLQQDPPAGPVDNFADHDFTPPGELGDRTLQVHCLLVGRPGEARYKRSGIASRMVARLIDWARESGWTAIQANSFEDIPILYEVTGCAGHTFWEKLGFLLVDRFPHPHLQERNEFVAQVEAQARSAGIDPDRARDLLVMRLELAGS